MKMVTVIGARPQFIKAAAVSRAVRATGRIEEQLLHTGQHYDENMSEIFFGELGIPTPKFNLGVRSVRHGEQTGRMLEGVESVLLEERPDIVLVYGDTNSTLAGALAAAKLSIPVAHVEAGLRSFNRRMPEELNRTVADHLSSLLFAPTEVAVTNLVREGIDTERINRVGDVMYDAAIFYGRKAEAGSGVLPRNRLEPGRYALATLHRAENTDDPHRLRAAFEGLAALAKRLPVVIPLHPRTRKMLAAVAGGTAWLEGLKIIDPVGYLDMVMLEKNARMIATDSGGVQKEAFFFGIPCATLREETEWTELVDSGWNTLVPPSGRTSVGGRLIDWLDAPVPAARPDYYGDGTAGERIVQAVEALLRR